MCQSSIVTRRRSLALAAALLVAVAAVLTAAGLHRARVSLEQEQTRPLAVGDCVAVAAGSPETVLARRASCGEDPSYTIGAMTDAGGVCPSTEYQHFPAPAADRFTAGLCLVPNLVADHCYRLVMPIGVVDRAACTEPRGGSDTGVLIQVTQRLDVHDQRACPAAGGNYAGGNYAWPYPSPARTYCTATLY